MIKDLNKLTFDFRAVLASLSVEQIDTLQKLQEIIEERLAELKEEQSYGKEDSKDKDDGPIKEKD